MTKFEAVLLFSPDLSNPIKEKEEKIFTDNIEKSEGVMISSEEWGLRDIAFNIDTYKKAFYKFYQIEINGSKIQDLKKALTQNERILRHLFIRVEEHQELPTKMTGDNEEK